MLFLYDVSDSLAFTSLSTILIQIIVFKVSDRRTSEESAGVPVPPGAFFIF